MDSQVAHHIFWQCIRDPALLRPKAVVLVTHNLQLVPQADAVALLDGRRVAFAGPLAGFLALDHDLAVRRQQHPQEPRFCYPPPCTLNGARNETDLAKKRYTPTMEHYLRVAPPTPRFVDDSRLIGALPRGRRGEGGCLV